MIRRRRDEAGVRTRDDQGAGVGDDPVIGIGEVREIAIGGRKEEETEGFQGVEREGNVETGMRSGREVEVEGNRGPQTGVRIEEGDEAAIENQGRQGMQIKGTFNTTNAGRRGISRGTVNHEGKRDIGI